LSGDARGRLASDPFDFHVTKDGSVRVSRAGAVVSVVGGARASRLVADLDAAADGAAQQQLLARVTGHYQHGTER
jgi:hypothetical protein